MVDDKDRIRELEQELLFWESWAIEYLLDYDIYDEEFLRKLELIEGIDKVKGIREKQATIISILKKEGLWKDK